MEADINKDKYDIPAISQYPTKVVAFSSQYGSENGSYSTSQLICNRPMVYPRYGDFCEACVLRYYGEWWSRAPSAPQQVGTHPNCYPTGYCTEDYLELEYEHPVYLQKFRVYETFIPGCIVAVHARQVMSDGSASWQQVWRRSGPSREPHVARIFEPELTHRPQRPVDRLWLAFNSRLAEYYTEIDTIELVGTLTEPPAAATDLWPLVQAMQIEAPDPGGQPEEELLSTTAGWFSHWPPELLTRMLGYLDLQSLLRLGQCNRLLLDYTSDPLLYRSVSLRPYCLGLTDSHLESLAGRVSATRHLELSWCSRVTPGNFCAFMRCTAEWLSTLRLASCSFLDDACLLVIATQCRSLVDLDLSSPSPSLTDSGFAALSIGLTRLRRLNLYRSKIGLESLIKFTAANPCLQHLNLGACSSLTTGGNEMAVALARACPELRSLDLWRSRSISCHGLSAIASGCRGLLELDIGWCSMVDSETGCLAELAQQCRGLQKLFLTANRSVRDVDLFAIAKHCKELRQLDILGTSLVSEDAVHHVLKSCPRLEMFDVSFCGGVKRSYIDSIREFFPHCAIQMSFQDQR